MAAIASIPTVRATAAPKVAVRRTSVRAAASGLRTQFGSSTKAFAPLGYVSRRPNNHGERASLASWLFRCVRAPGAATRARHEPTIGTREAANTAATCGLRDSRSMRAFVRVGRWTARRSRRASPSAIS
jgi:hypothetical protein